MKKSLIVSILCIFYTFSVFAQNKEERELIEKTILENDNRLEEFFKLSNVDSIVGMFSPNSHFMPEYQKILEKRDAIEEYFTKHFKSGIKYSEFKLKAEEHKVYDDLVLEVGENIVKYTKGSEGKQNTEKYNYMLIWKRSKKGKYQIRAAMWNSVEKPCE